MVKINCDFCNKEINIRPCRIKSFNYHFCNRDCYIAYKKAKHTFVCANCGKIFFNAKRLGQIYCSNKCRYESQKNKNNNYILKGSYVEVLIDNKNGKYTVLLDKEDWDKIDSSIRVYKKEKDATSYAYIKGIGLHRYIMNCPKDMVIDHINHNGLDNRKSNLRICTVAENARNLRLTDKNKSGYIGVSWSKKEKKWKATLKIKNKTYTGGLFNNINDAIDARKKLEEIHWKEKEKING